MSKSILQSKKECYLCRKEAAALGYYGDLTEKGLDRHHIMYGTAGRQQSERWGVWCWLCKKHHNEDHGLFAVHYNSTINRELRKDAEKSFLRVHSYDKWMDVFGSNYLEPDEIENAEKTKYETVSKAETIDKKGTGEGKNKEKPKKTECPEGFYFIT